MTPNTATSTTAATAGDPTTKPERLLRQPAVLERVCLSRTEWYRRVKAGKAPASVRLGDNATAWRESDIAAYIANLPTNTQTETAVQTSALPLFCKDCAHIEHKESSWPGHPPLAMCAAPEGKLLHLDEGPIRELCEIVRGTRGKCGPEGRLFLAVAADGVGDAVQGDGDAVDRRREAVA